MNKKGFTLMELIVYLAIAAIITAVAVTSIASVNNFRIEYTNKICQKEMALFIHRARMYCYAKGVRGSVNLDIPNNKLIFVSENVTVDEFYLQNKKLKYGNLSKLTIDFYGKIKEAGELKFFDENNNAVKITIHVASEYVDEK